MLGDANQQFEEKQVKSYHAVIQNGSSEPFNNLKNDIRLRFQLTLMIHTAIHISDNVTISKAF